jgi:hypothetical protein
MAKFNARPAAQRFPFVHRPSANGLERFVDLQMAKHLVSFVRSFEAGTARAEGPADRVFAKLLMGRLRARAREHGDGVASMRRKLDQLAAARRAARAGLKPGARVVRS